MTSWICSVCGFSHGDFEDTCFGCHHPGTSLEHWIDCPECGDETPKSEDHCRGCQADLAEDVLDEDDDRLDDESD